MTDIVSHLRDAERYGQFGRSLLYGQVADEIERLRSEIERLRSEIERLRSEIGMITPIGDDSDIKPHDHSVNPTDRADERNL
jgi:hypothetical protein